MQAYIKQQHGVKTPYTMGQVGLVTMTKEMVAWLFNMQASMLPPQFALHFLFYFFFSLG